MHVWHGKCMQKRTIVDNLLRISVSPLCGHVPCHVRLVVAGLWALFFLKILFMECHNYSLTQKEVSYRFATR